MPNKKMPEKSNKEELIYDNKEYYTIEDLIDITKVLERTENQIKNANLDIKALENTISRLDKKIANAKSYIEEIEEHKKSIFEFWKFVNKDNLLGLNEGEVEEKVQKQIEKTFDYEEDLEEFGKKQDKKNRQSYLKEERDSIFLASTEVINDINTLKNEENKDFTKRIQDLKEEALKEEMLFASEEFDIFGGITEDKTKINILGNTKHREIKKSKFRLLEINKNTENSNYINTLEQMTRRLENALDKSEFGMKLNTFFASTEALNNQKYAVLYINPQNALDTLKDAEKINLFNIKLNEKSKAIALTNIMYYENTNRTLPLGMNVSDKILVDMGKLKLEPKKQKLFRMNQKIDDYKVETKIICIYEYEAVEE